MYEDVCLFFGAEVHACLRLCISHEEHTVRMCECYLCISSLSRSVSAPDVLGVTAGLPRCVQVCPAVSRHAAQTLLRPQNRSEGQTHFHSRNVKGKDFKQAGTSVCLC